MMNVQLSLKISPCSHISEIHISLNIAFKPEIEIVITLSGLTSKLCC